MGRADTATDLKTKGSGSPSKAPLTKCGVHPIRCNSEAVTVSVKQDVSRCDPPLNNRCNCVDCSGLGHAVRRRAKPQGPLAQRTARRNHKCVHGARYLGRQGKMHCVIRSAQKHNSRLPDPLQFECSNRSGGADGVVAAFRMMGYQVPTESLGRRRANQAGTVTKDGKAVRLAEPPKIRNLTPPPPFPMQHFD